MRWPASHVGIVAALVLIVGGQVGAFLLTRSDVGSLRADEHAQAYKTRVVTRRVAHLERRRAATPRRPGARREQPAQSRSRVISGPEVTQRVSRSPSRPAPARQPAAARPAAGPVSSSSPAPLAPTAPPVTPTVTTVVHQVCHLLPLQVKPVCGGG